MIEAFPIQDILILAGFIALSACAIRSHMRKYDHLKNHETLSRMPLEISPDEFRKRFREQLESSRVYFQGELFSDTEFYIQYIPPFMRYKQWIALRGVIKETEILYDVNGKPIYRSKEFETDRLITKLQELCSK